MDLLDTMDLLDIRIFNLLFFLELKPLNSLMLLCANS